MSRNGTCNACMMGEHEHHTRVVHAVSDGMLGGVVCICKGECRNVTADERLRRLGVPPGLFRRKPSR